MLQNIKRLHLFWQEELTPQGYSINWLYTGILLSVMFVGFGSLLWLSFTGKIFSYDIKVIIISTFLGGITITAYCHRLISHRVSKYITLPVHLFFIPIQTLAIQAPASVWGGNHRAHHGCADQPNDPYSPLKAKRYGKFSMFMWSHMITHMVNHPAKHQAQYDKLRDGVERDFPLLTLQRKYYVFLLTVLGLGVIPALGFAFTGTLEGTLRTWIDVVIAIAIVHQVTWSVNSFTHMFGQKSIKSSARNMQYILPSIFLYAFGEGIGHGHHHDYSRDYRNSLYKWAWIPILDPTRQVLLILHHSKLIGDLHKTPPAKEAEILLHDKMQKKVSPLLLQLEKIKAGASSAWETKIAELKSAYLDALIKLAEFKAQSKENPDVRSEYNFSLLKKNLLESKRDFYEAVESLKQEIAVT